MPLRDVRVELTLPGYVEFATFVAADLPAKGQVTVAPPDRVQFHNGNFKTLTEPEPVCAGAAGERAARQTFGPVRGVRAAAAGVVRYGSQEGSGLLCHPQCRGRGRSRRQGAIEASGVLPGTVGFVDALESSRPEACQRAMECRTRRCAAVTSFTSTSLRNDGPGWETWQRVRFHGEVMHDREGTCIDLVLLFAACLENVLFDPLIIIVATAHDVLGRVTEQHAVMGYCGTQPGEKEGPAGGAGGTRRRRCGRVDRAGLDGDFRELMSTRLADPSPMR